MDQLSPSRRRLNRRFGLIVSPIRNNRSFTFPQITFLDRSRPRLATPRTAAHLSRLARVALFPIHLGGGAIVAPHRSFASPSNAGMAKLQNCGLYFSRVVREESAMQFRLLRAQLQLK